MKFIKNFIMSKKIFLFLTIFLFLNCKERDRERPYVSIIFPADGYVFPPDTLDVKVKAYDNKGIDFVELYLNDTLKVGIKYSPDSHNIWIFKLDFTHSPDSMRYTLKARAVDKSGNFSFSSKVNILVTYGNHPPLIPELLFPPDKYTFRGNICTLRFKSSDPDEDTVIYDLFLSFDSIPSIYLPDYYDTLLIDTLEYGKTYFWKIKAKDGKGGESESEVRSFSTSTENNPPAIPSNPSPYPGDTLVPLLPDFSWKCNDPDGDSLLYDFYLDSRQDFSNPIIFYPDLSDTHFTPSFSLLPGVLYFWKVKARDGRGGEVFSPLWNFKTKKFYLLEIYSSGVFSRDLKIYGDYLYEIGGETKYFSLKIYYLSNPEFPVLLKEITLNEIPWIIEINDDFCGIVCGTYKNKVRVYKKVSHDSLEFLKSFILRGQIGEAKINGNSLFLIDTKGVVKIGLSDSPYIYDSINTSLPPIDFDLSHWGKLYLLTGNSSSCNIETYDFNLHFLDSKSFEISNARSISFLDSALCIANYGLPSNSVYLISLTGMIPDTVIYSLTLNEGVQVTEYFSPFLFLSMDNKIQMLTFLKNKIYFSSYPLSIPNVYGIVRKDEYVYLSSFSNKGFCVLKWME